MIKILTLTVHSQTNIYGWDQEWKFEDILSQEGLTVDKAAKVKSF